MTPLHTICVVFKTHDVPILTDLVTVSAKPGDVLLVVSTVYTLGRLFVFVIGADVCGWKGAASFRALR